MKLSEAQDIVILYTTLFGKEFDTSKTARCEDELYHSKSEIIQAYKFYMAYVGMFHALDKEEVDLLFYCLSRLNIFTSFTEQEYINQLKLKMDQQKKLFKPKLLKKEFAYLSQFIINSYSNEFSVEIIDAYNKSQEHIINWVNEGKDISSYEFYHVWFEEIVGVVFTNELAEEVYESGTKQYEQRANVMKTVNDIDFMTRKEFNTFVSQLFEKMGYRTRISKPSEDHGADILAYKNDKAIVIKTNCFSSIVGNSSIHEVVAGSKHFKIKNMIVITNGYFTKDALTLAQANDVILWDRDMLRVKINENQ
jgi:hypothetical protein